MSFGELSLGGLGELLNITNLGELFGLLFVLFFRLGIALALLFVIISGIKFVTSSGDAQKFEEAKNSLVNTIIGALIIICFLVIINMVLNLLGIGNVQTILDPP